MFSLQIFSFQCVGCLFSMLILKIPHKEDFLVCYNPICVILLLSTLFLGSLFLKKMLSLFQFFNTHCFSSLVPVSRITLLLKFHQRCYNWQNSYLFPIMFVSIKFRKHSFTGGCFQYQCGKTFWKSSGYQFIVQLLGSLLSCLL